MLRVQQIRLSLDEDISELPIKLCKKLRIKEEDLLTWQIFKESIDARKENDIHFMYSIDCKIKFEESILKWNRKDIEKTPDYQYKMPVKGELNLVHRPVVVGFGPAGMFSALLLAQMGYQPIILERGECIEQRAASVEKFWNEGILNPMSNVQFGEGGAGTFSDGKLTTRVKDTRVYKILEELVRFGAPEEILYEAHPHIGTDLLRQVVKNIREEILSLGGEIRFETMLKDVTMEKGKVVSVQANDEVIPCEQLILAIGHSARDTMRMLMEKGFAVEAKAFAIGARIEHPQQLINTAQYKSNANHPKLSTAEYRLTHSASNGRGVYTFCMCPGGYVVPSTSMDGGVVVNGMSEHARNGENANSAIIVQVRPEDYGNDPYKAIEFQEGIERKAFEVAGSNYHAPVQLVKDFLAHTPSSSMGSVKPSYVLGVTPCDLHDILPAYVCEAMEEGIQGFDRKLKGFAMSDAVLTGVETRSTSPVRMTRSREDCVALEAYGCYPCGEGAGYAGGIVSAAIDGIRCAEQIIQKFTYATVSE